MGPDGEAPRMTNDGAHAMLNISLHRSGLSTLAFVAVLAHGQAFADTRSFRCGNDLVNVGDSKTSALLKCGQPVAKDAFCKPVVNQPGGGTGKRSPVVVNAGCEAVDEWTYNPGYGQFMTTLRFESGKLVSISYGDRVP
jgi:Protein of unknown function (DUF2845)